MGNDYFDTLLQKKSRQTKGFIKYSEVSLAHILASIAFCPECNLDFRVVGERNVATGDNEYIEVFEKSKGDKKSTFEPVKVNLFRHPVVVRNFEIDRLVMKVYKKFKEQNLLSQAHAPLTFDEKVLLSSLTKAVSASKRNLASSDGDKEFSDIKKSVCDKILQLNVYRKVYNNDSTFISKNKENILVSILSNLNFFGHKLKDLSLELLTWNHDRFLDTVLDLQRLNKVIHASSESDNVDNDFICSPVGYKGDKICADLSCLYRETLANSNKFSSDEISPNYSVESGDNSYTIHTKIGNKNAKIVSYDIASSINKFGAISPLVFQPWWPDKTACRIKKDDIQKMASVNYGYVSGRKAPYCSIINKKPDLEPSYPNIFGMRCYLKSAPLTMMYGF